MDTQCTHFSTLATKGLRRTKDRHGILRLFDGERTWTVAQLHARLPRMDLSTVYRNVRALAEAGILDEARVRGSETHYERTGRPHHGHSVCERCGAARCVPCPVTGIPDDHALEIYGTCGDCAA